MGFSDDWFREVVGEMIDRALNKPHPRGWIKGITRQRLEKEGHVRLNLGDGPFLPFAQGGFFTPSGKAELYNERMAAAGLDPVACFVAPQESRHTEAARKFPLELLARKADNYLNTSFCNIPSLQRLEAPELLEIHATDAGPRGIPEADWVRVFNDRGEVRLPAHLHGTVHPRVAASLLNC